MNTAAWLRSRLGTVLTAFTHWTVVEGSPPATINAVVLFRQLVRDSDKGQRSKPRPQTHHDFIFPLHVHCRVLHS